MGADKPSDREIGGWRFEIATAEDTAGSEYPIDYCPLAEDHHVSLI